MTIINAEIHPGKFTVKLQYMEIRVKKAEQQIRK